MDTSVPPRGPSPWYWITSGMRPSTSTRIGWSTSWSHPPLASTMSLMLSISVVSCGRGGPRPEVVAERGLQLRLQVEAVQGEKLLPDGGEAAIGQDQPDGLGHSLGVPREVGVEVGQRPLEALVAVHQAEVDDVLE